ncbi:HEAT repeat domain containing protein [Entamoeba marina]
MADKLHIIRTLLSETLDGQKQDHVLVLLEECLRWDDFIVLLLNELRQLTNPAQLAMGCILLKQSIVAGMKFNHEEALFTILPLVNTIQRPAILVVTHIFMITLDDIRREILLWIHNNITSPSTIELFYVIITDNYSCIGNELHQHISTIINDLIPLLGNAPPNIQSLIIKSLKEISYSPPPEFPYLYKQLLQLILPLISRPDLRLSVGTFICESPFVLSESLTEFLPALKDACDVLLSDVDDEIFCRGCDLLESLISRHENLVDLNMIRKVLPRTILSEEEELEISEGVDDEMQNTARNSAGTILQVAISYYPTLIHSISSDILRATQSNDWKCVEMAFHIVTCLENAITSEIFNTYFSTMPSLLIPILQQPFPLLQRKIADFIGLYIGYFPSQFYQPSLSSLFDFTQHTDPVLQVAGMNALNQASENYPNIVAPFATQIYTTIVSRLSSYSTQTLNLAMDLLATLIDTTPFLTPQLLHPLFTIVVQLTAKHLDDDFTIEALFTSSAFLLQRTRDIQVEDIVPLLSAVKEVLQFNWKRGVDDSAVGSCIQMLDVIGQICGCGVLVHCGISEVLCWGISRKERRIQVASLALAGRVFDNDIHSINNQALAKMDYMMVNLQNNVSMVFERIVNATVAVYKKDVLMKHVVLKKNVLVVLSTIGGLNPGLVIPHLDLITGELLEYGLQIANESIRFGVLRLVGLLICEAPKQCQNTIQQAFIN